MGLNYKLYTGAGPTPKYSLYHVWKTYDTIFKEGPVGRKALSQIVGIGEGSIRTILNKMIGEGFVTVGKNGVSLTDRGIREYLDCGMSVAQVDLNGVTISSQDCAVLVKGMAAHMGNGNEQRDEAVYSGAEGATSFVAKNGKLYYPCSNMCPDEDTTACLKTAFNIRDGDVIIIGTAKKYRLAEQGAVTAALALENQVNLSWVEKNVWESFGPDTEAEALQSIALAVHELTGRLPTTMRSKNCNGVRCEDGLVIDNNYTGPVLEEVLESAKITHKISPSGPYMGVPVVAVPVMKKNKAVAVFGIVDITKCGMFELVSKTHKGRR